MAVAGAIHPSETVAETLVHALAQLPAEVSAELSCQPREGRQLALIASAYGIDERVTMDGSGRVPSHLVRGGAVADTSSSTLGELVEALWPPDARPPSPMADDGLLAGHRVAIVTNLPTHYRTPLFTRLAERLAGCRAELVVLFLGSDDKARSWIRSSQQLQFEHQFLGGVSMPLRRRRPPILAPLLTRTLRRSRPTMLIAPGFAPAATIPCMLYAARHAVPAGIWSGEIAETASLRRGRPLAVRSAVARRASFGIAYGSRAREYLRMVAPEMPAVIGRNSSVVETLELDRPERPSPVELVMVADLALPGKGAEVALDALRSAADLDCRLTVVGTRPSGRLASQAQSDRRVRLIGPLPPEGVRETLRASDVFLFPSRIDVFGLALVEAMAAGVAPIVSPVPGAVADLAVPGTNCLVAGEGAEWISAIRQLVLDHALRSRLGTAAQRTVAKRWTIDHSVESMLAGMRLGALSSAGGPA